MAKFLFQAQELGTPDKLLRVQHGIHNCFKNRSSKELIVAMEWSGNHEVLNQLLSWTENEIKTPAVTKLEVEHVKKPAEAKSEEDTSAHLELGLSSMNITATETAVPEESISHLVTPTVRTISWNNCENVQLVVISDDYIALGWDEEIGIYARQNLACTRILKAGSSPRLQCAVTDGKNIIACFDDSTMYVWDIKSGRLIQDPLNLPGGKFCTFSRCMKYRNAELTIGNNRGDVGLWKFKNNTLALAQKWVACPGKRISSVDFDERLIVLFMAEKYLIQVWNKNGYLLRQLQNLDFVAMKYCGGRIVSGRKHGVLRFWNPDTLECNGKFKCPCVVNMNERYIVTEDDGCGTLLFWNLEDVLNKEEQAVISPLFQLKCVGKKDTPMVGIGNDLLVCYRGNRKSVDVLEFE